MNEINVSIEVNNLPKNIKSGWMVARLDQSYGRSDLWYYGTYDTKERANEVAVELGNGIVLHTV